MSTLTASSLSQETSRLDRAAADRARRPAEGDASPGGGQGFAGLLRAAGVQAPAESTAEPRAATSRPDDASRTERASRAAAPTASAVRPAPTPAPTPAATEGARAESARTERSRAPGATDRADASPREPDETDAGDAEADPSTDGGTGAPTLAHWLQQTPAQRAAAAAKGAARAIGRDVASRGSAGAAMPAGAETGSTDAAARRAGSAVGGPLPGWASRDAGTGWVLGQWAGGADGVHAASGWAASGDGAAGRLALDAAASPVAETTLPPPAPGTEAPTGFASQLAAMVGGGQAPSSPLAPAAMPAQVDVHTPVGAAGFGDEVMVKVAALSQDGVQEAQLHLNPAELGPIQVRIAIEGGQARIDFGATAESTRHLLESALPALAQALQADGLQLGASSVGELAPPIEAASAGRPDGQGDLSGQAGGRGGGWGQRDEPGAGGRAGPAPGVERSGDPLRGWVGAVAPRAGTALRGLDLYA